MDKRHLIKTGDALLFSGNTPTGFLLRTFVSSQWNHSGIGVRFVDDPSAPGGRRVSLTEEGELYVFETNTGVREDTIFGGEIVGAGFSKSSWVFRKYNLVACRPLRACFRTPALAEATMAFARLTRGNRFPSTSLPFISVWLGISLGEKGEETEAFCSELMANYYAYAVGPQFAAERGLPFDGRLCSLFGPEAPESAELFAPGNFSAALTPAAPIFAATDEKVYVRYGDFLYVLLQPFLIILVVMLAIYMSLPGNERLV